MGNKRYKIFYLRKSTLILLKMLSLNSISVQCGDLSDPDSGFVSLTTNGLYTVATFSCVTGYTLNSTGILTCMSTGAWDLSSPYCSEFGFFSQKNTDINLLRFWLKFYLSYLLKHRSLSLKCSSSNNRSGWTFVILFCPASDVCPSNISQTTAPLKPLELNWFIKKSHEWSFGGPQLSC